MKAGNARFVAGHPLHRDFPSHVKATASGQYPFAVVLSCLDSRQPIEIVLDQGIGDIFSARVAGNVLDDDILGSMEFACKVSGAKLIAVIGHSNCGAIKGAVDDVELGNLTGLLAKIKPAIGRRSRRRSAAHLEKFAFVDQVPRPTCGWYARRSANAARSCARCSTRAKSAWSAACMIYPPARFIFMTNKPEQIKRPLTNKSPERLKRLKALSERLHGKFKNFHDAGRFEKNARG